MAEEGEDREEEMNELENEGEGGDEDEGWCCQITVMVKTRVESGHLAPGRRS